MKKESIFTKEGFFGCDVFNLWFWKLRRSTLFRKVVSGGYGGVFPEEVWSSSGRKRQVDCFSSTFKKEVEDFSQRLGKTGQFFCCLQTQVGILSGKEKHSLWVFFSRCIEGWSCSPSSLIRHSQSSRWFFSVILLEDVIVEDWGGFQNSSPSLGKTRGLLLWPNFNHWGRENAGTEVTFFLLPAGMLQRRSLHSRVSWISYPDGVE